MIKNSQHLIFGLALLGMLVDTVLPNPNLNVRHEYEFKGLVPEHRVQGFASERQWLFAHRKFRNQCVLEALAAEKKGSADPLRLASTR